MGELPYPELNLDQWPLINVTLDSDSLGLAGAPANPTGSGVDRPQCAQVRQAMVNCYCPHRDGAIIYSHQMSEAREPH